MLSNVSTGTIFSVFYEDFLKKDNQRLSGYFLYGASTLLCLAFHNIDGVHNFTLEPYLGSWYVSDQQKKISNIYSISSNCEKEYRKICQDKEYSFRCVGSITADHHRTMIKGGIYIYSNIQIYFDAKPLAMIMEKNGGRAVTVDNRRVLDIEANDMNHKIDFVCGIGESINSYKSPPS
eukprot:GHVL01003461.1.p2 GENE.GHVL01003461.1~~GHVL01003461.1.p2  ORF type:complete len:178 (+),score=33.44 GHVL01003461.1:360-893(+)